MLQWHKIFLNCGENVNNSSKPCTHKTIKTDDNVDKVRNSGKMSDV
jgi:hypothetical protein